ncbi:hypothetical protein [Providencia burhodogranariea]|uniref:hypothetical protein n=1 Tax=Providencia burhodogranariea TaxID=516074 RepID=UPI00030FB702|nr:hypothetical protein [Providencia burhodogranariea]
MSFQSISAVKISSKDKHPLKPSWHINSKSVKAKALFLRDTPKSQYWVSRNGKSPLTGFFHFW